MAPIACSRTPKWTVRSSPGSAVFTLPARSAEPPTIVGTKGANAFIAWPPAARVAIFSPSHSMARASASPDSGSSAQARSHSAARPGSAARHAAKRSRQAALAEVPRSAAAPNAS